MKKCILRRLKKSERGVAFIELALIAPILLILLLGIVEFGWIYNGYITLTGAAREGARVAAVDGNYIKAVEVHVKSLPALDASISSISGGENQGDDINVQVTGDLSLLTGGSFNLSAEATMRRQYLD